MSAGEIRCSARLSVCGRYRYDLRRSWAPAPRRGHVAWVLCNPSTADAFVDDATVRKCMGFALLWGANGIVIVNVCAWRSRHPRDLLTVDDPVGPANRGAFEHVAQDWHFHDANGYGGIEHVVCGWGNALPKRLHEHAETALGWLEKSAIPTHCLGRTKGGQPRHPLMLAYSTSLEPFDDRCGRNKGEVE